MTTSLHDKLTRLKTNASSNAFILADAKDADMAFGMASPGRDPATGQRRSVQDYRREIRNIVEQGLIDICLMSASTCEQLAKHERLFLDSAVTPAVRANDSTDIWLANGTGDYPNQPSLPFRSAHLEQVMLPAEGQTDPSVNLGLYSITPTNDAHRDRDCLRAYAEFRQQARTHGLHHFLEVFAPHPAWGDLPDDIGRFVCDTVARTLAGLTESERPLFLKIPYFGPELTEELVAYDTSVIVGIMGGPAGTTHDAFALLEQAKRHGVRAALFGRHINYADDQLLFVRHLRLIADGQVSAVDAVKSYHNELSQKGVIPTRNLEDDLHLSTSHRGARYDNAPSTDTPTP